MKIAERDFYFYIRTRNILFYLGFVFIYFKTYKYKRFLYFFRKKQFVGENTDPTDNPAKLNIFDSIYEYIKIYPEDMLVVFFLAISLFLILRIRKTIIREMLKALYFVIGLLILTILFFDSQIYKVFNVGINLEFIYIGVNWPGTLLQGKSEYSSPSRLIRYGILFVFIITSFTYLLYSNRFVHTIWSKSRQIKRINPIKFLIALVIILCIVPLPLLRPLDGIQKMSFTPILKDITETILTSSSQTKELKNYIKTYPLNKTYFNQKTGVQNLNIKDSNVIIILLESTSFKYFYNSRYRYKLFPYLSKLHESSNTIKVNTYYTNVPHSSVARGTLITGNYSRPDRFFRDYEVYNPTNLIRVFKESGHNAYFLHTCNLKFENQREYFTKFGLNVLDGKWFKKKIKTSEPRVGWGYDDMRLVDVGMKELLEKNKNNRFIVFFSFILPHWPYGVPKHYKNPELKPLLKKKPRVFKKYIRSISYQDVVIRNLMDQLKANKLLQNTLILVISDHGESFNEHGYQFHNVSLYNEEIKTIFFMNHPKFKKSKIKSLEIGSHVDVFPTIMDIFGQKSNQKIHGLSLFNQDIQRKIHFHSWTRQINSAFIKNNVKYIYNSLSKNLKKFDLIKDPEELNPEILDTNTNKAIIEELKNSRRAIILNYNNNHIEEKK
jgi:hypothetical protein